LLLNNNYRFSVRLAEVAFSEGYRFIYASSAATYGDGSCGFNDDHAALEHAASVEYVWLFETSF